MNETDRNETKKEIIQIMASVLNIEADTITEDLELDADLNIDSLALYEIVVDIEEKYSLQISNDEADDLKTVGEAIDFIMTKIQHP
ncbi:MAG: acyl carrier protein [Saccharofermentanales bacterium]